jgi:iron complex transport system substrate-binding protein
VPRSSRRPVRSRVLAVVATIAAVPLLAGCAPSDDLVGGPEAVSAAPASGYPVTVDNCGTEVTVDAAPERIVTIKSTTTELLLALGLGDRIVGQAFPDGPVPDEWATEGDEIPVISDFAPSSEAVLDLEPDAVFGGWESNFSADAAGDRDTLQALGVTTYVAPSACREPGYQPDPLTFDGLFDEIAEAGRVFGAEDAAAGLLADQRARLDAVTPDDRGLTALWYSSGTDTPYVGAGIGAPAMMLDAVGLDNVAGDVDDAWTSLGWEAVVDANPDVIVLVDASWNTAESKIALLEANPATAALPAVQQGRYLTIPFAAGEGGVRNVEAVERLASQLADLEF